MPWTKLGRIFEPGSSHPALSTHAANPLALHLTGDLFRILYCGRDPQNRSSVGFVDCDIGLCKPIHAHEEPLFGPGPKGSFFENGVSIGNAYWADGKRYVLFMGWSQPAGERWRGQIGRFELDGEWTATLRETEPILALDETDPISLSYPFVARLNSGEYRMWYGSTLAWDAGNGEMLHVIKQAQSADGHKWSKLSDAVPHAVGVAQAFSRPSVILDAGHSRMWYGYRPGTGASYRIGCADSQDATRWTLRAAPALDVSADGWDSGMVEYPFVFAHAGRLYMLYNGNGFGRSGFGLAVFEEDR